jgi:radical SAM superfamily enzyme YgiQ (UPF0313 family)
VSRRLREKARALLSKERGTVHKEPGGHLSVCLVYPNTYHVGMSNLGFQGVYTMINARDDMLCERAFLPDPEDMDEYARRGVRLASLESGRPLAEFDIVAFSVPFENDYPHILRILQLAHIPLRSAERTQLDPLVVMGGVCAFSNPEPLAPFMDSVLVGEAEGLLDAFLDAFENADERGAFLEDAARIDGVYVPSLYEVEYGADGHIRERRALRGAPQTVRRMYAPDISASPVRASIVTPETEFSDMVLIEAMRGCPWSCRFCLAGHVFNPPRKKPAEAVLREVEDARRLCGGHLRVGLIGPSLSDYPDAAKVLGVDGVEFSITSLRASRKSAELVERLRGHRSVSIAPEAGTERMRQVVNKKVTEQDILESAGLIFASGIEKLRLYFMVGLPTETDEDIDGIVELTRKIRALSDKGHISLTLSTFVPKPCTPFQWEPMTEMGTVKSRLSRVKKALKGLRGVGVFHDVPKYAWLQGMLAMGDRRVAEVLVRMLDEPDWRRAAREAGIDPAFYTMRAKGRDESLPWDFIGHGIDRQRLWEARPEQAQ